MELELTLPFVLFVTAVQFVCFLIKGIAGFGDPLISNPVFSLYLDNKVISPMNLCIGTPLNAYISWKNRKSFSIIQALPMAACILLGVVPGTFLLKYASSWVLKAALGILILLIGIEMITRVNAKPRKPNNVVMALLSFCSGVTAGMFGINLFFVAYLERTTTDRAAFRGNVCFLFFVENCFRCVMYAVTGVFTKEAFIMFLISLPGVVLGFFVGTKVDKRLNEATVRRIIIFMFMLGGASVLIKALITRS